MALFFFSTHARKKIIIKWSTWEIRDARAVESILTFFFDPNKGLLGMHMTDDYRGFLRVTCFNKFITQHILSFGERKCTPIFAPFSHNIRSDHYLVLFSSIETAGQTMKQ